MSTRALLRSVRRATRLSRAEWRVVAEAWWELLRAELTISVLPFGAWRKRVRTRAERAASEREFDLRVPELVSVAASHHVRSLACLPRALAMRAMFERRGHAVALQYGARRIDGQLDAHVWLVVDGVPVDTGAGIAGHYEPLVPAGSQVTA